jgi:hypothetical protein
MWSAMGYAILLCYPILSSNIIIYYGTWIAHFRWVGKQWSDKKNAKKKSAKKNPPGNCFSDSVMQDVVQMTARNIFRSLPVKNKGKGNYWMRSWSLPVKNKGKEFTERKSKRKTWKRNENLLERNPLERNTQKFEEKNPQQILQV